MSSSGLFLSTARVLHIEHVVMLCRQHRETLFPRDLWGHGLAQTRRLQKNNLSTGFNYEMSEECSWCFPLESFSPIAAIRIFLIYTCMLLLQCEMRYPHQLPPALQFWDQILSILWAFPSSLLAQNVSSWSGPAGPRHTGNWKSLCFSRVVRMPPLNDAIFLKNPVTKTTIIGIIWFSCCEPLSFSSNSQL